MTVTEILSTLAGPVSAIIAAWLGYRATVATDRRDNCCRVGRDDACVACPPPDGHGPGKASW